MIEKQDVRCLYVEKVGDAISLSVKNLPADKFQTNEVTIQVAYSSLNFKDSLACQGHPGVIKTLPHVPGIDLAGTVIDSQASEFSTGDQVIVTGYDLGQAHWGGWAEIASVPANWIVRLPAGLTLSEAMFIGTAGFTAAQCLTAIQRNRVLPEVGPIVVTGATGGVGSLAVRLLARAGYEVVAVTGKPAQAEALTKIGASRVISREELISGYSARPLLSAQWAGAIDTVGGQMLGHLLKTTMYGGCVTACGLVGGHDLQTSVYPFLLRGISLCGAASADCPMATRLELWQKLASDWKPQHTELLSHEVGLEQLPDYVQQISRGELAGRVVVKCS